MKYFEVEFTIANRAGSPVDADTLQLLRDLLPSLVAEAGFESFEDTPQGLRGFVQTDSFDETALKEGLQQLSGLMPAASPDEGTLSVSYTVADAEDKNWNADWEREGFEPICIDNRCIIHDTLHPLPFVAQPSPLTICIDARQAFGTGNHETTRMIVGRLLDLDLQGKRVLDCGCGTGILSIVAAKCGAKEAVAVFILRRGVVAEDHVGQFPGAVRNFEGLDRRAVVDQGDGVFLGAVRRVHGGRSLTDLMHHSGGEIPVQH